MEFHCTVRTRGARAGVWDSYILLTSLQLPSEVSNDIISPAGNWSTTRYLVQWVFYCAAVGQDTQSDGALIKAAVAPLPVKRGFEK